METETGALPAEVRPLVGVGRSGDAGSMLKLLNARASYYRYSGGYGFRPGNDTRSFGQQRAHIANANYLFCYAARGETNPYPGAVPGSRVR